MRLDDVIRSVNVGHPLSLGGVLLLQVGVIDRTEIAGVNVDGGGRITYVAEASECPFFAELLFAVRGGIGEDDKILLIVGVRSLDQPDANAVVGVLVHTSTFASYPEVYGGRDCSSVN